MQRKQKKRKNKKNKHSEKKKKEMNNEWGNNRTKNRIMQNSLYFWGAREGSLNTLELYQKRNIFIGLTKKKKKVFLKGKIAKGQNCRVRGRALKIWN